MRILNSFSMGRSSALMSARLRDLYPSAEIVTVTANTGQESPLSLVFGRRVTEHLGLQTALVEAVVDPRPNVGTTHKLTSWGEAYFGDDIFESVIAKVRDTEPFAPTLYA